MRAQESASQGSWREVGQGIVGVERPDGRELEFRAPASGGLFVTDADVTDKLERLLDGTT